MSTGKSAEGGETGLEALLAGHAYRTHPHVGPGGGVCTGVLCECGEKLSGYADRCLTWQEMDHLHRAHLAEAIQAAGWHSLDSLTDEAANEIWANRSNGIYDTTPMQALRWLESKRNG